MTTRALIGLLCIALVAPSHVTAQEAKEVESIRKCFDGYLQATWVKKRELMTEEAWVAYTMDAFYAKRQLAETEIARLGLQNYKLPELPFEYDRTPDKDAIAGARKITKAAYADLRGKLGEKFTTLVERVCDTQKPHGNPTLQDIKILDDKVTATAECRVDGANLLVPMRFRKDGGNWRFDGKNELLFFDRQR